MVGTVVRRNRGFSVFRKFSSYKTIRESRRADSNRLPLLIRSVLVTIWMRLKVFLAELRPFLPNASTQASLNGGLVVALTHRCIATPLFLGTHNVQFLNLTLG